MAIRLPGRKPKAAAPKAEPKAAAKAKPARPSRSSKAKATPVAPSPVEVVEEIAPARNRESVDDEWR